MRAFIIPCLMIIATAFLLVSCTEPTEPVHEEYPGGGGYYPDHDTNYIDYDGVMTKTGEDQANYTARNIISGEKVFAGITCSRLNMYTYDPYNYNDVYSYYLHDNELVDDTEGKLLCYGREIYNADGSLRATQIYPKPSLWLDYPLEKNKSWDECNYTDIPPVFFDLPSNDLDGDGIEDTINLLISHKVLADDAFPLSEAPSFGPCFQIEDTYSIHCNFSWPSFPYPSDYEFVGVSYYRAYIGWIKSALTTEMLDITKTRSLELKDWYVGGPTKE